MIDVLTEEQRSYCMSRIRAQDTKPEMVVRSLLHRMGYRFRLHRRDLPGKPDIVLPSKKKIILVHGCFWHRHARCRYATEPQTNESFWRDKLDRNVKRDRKIKRELRKIGWGVRVVWECEIKNLQRLERTLMDFLR